MSDNHDNLSPLLCGFNFSEPLKRYTNLIILQKNLKLIVRYAGFHRSKNNEIKMRETALNVSPRHYSLLWSLKIGNFEQ